MEMLNEIGKRAKIAKYDVQKYTTQMKNEALVHIANKLVACSDEILKANQIDISKAKENEAESHTTPLRLKKPQIFLLHIRINTIE